MNTLLNVSNCVIDTSVIQAIMNSTETVELATIVKDRIEKRETKAFMSIDGLRDILVPVFSKHGEDAADKLEQTLTNQIGISIRIPTSKVHAFQTAQIMTQHKIDSAALAAHIVFAKELEVPLLVDYEVDQWKEWNIQDVETINLRELLNEQGPEPNETTEPIQSNQEPISTEETSENRQVIGEGSNESN